MKRSSTAAFLAGGVALVIFIFVLLVTQTSTITDSNHFRRLDRAISLFVRNLNNGDYQAAAYQFHYLEAQSHGGVPSLAESLHRLASVTGFLSYEPHDIAHTRIINGKVQYRASLTITSIETATSDVRSIDILAYEESIYGGPTIAVFDGKEFKEPL